MANPKLFGVDIQGILANAIPVGSWPAVTLTQRTPGTRTPGSEASGTNPTSNSYTSRGIVDRYRRSFKQGAQKWVQSSHRVLIIAKPFEDLSVQPKADDLLVVEGLTFSVIHVERDPAAATWTLYVLGG